MSDVEQGCYQVMDDQKKSQLSLLDLPVEIFLHICSFLDATTVGDCLSLACKQFNEILSDDFIWKMKISHMCPHSDYPILPPAEVDELYWKLSCMELEKSISLWSEEESIKESMEKLSLKDMQASTIDALHLVHNGSICISGARDRSLVCWKLPNEDNEKENVTRINFAHNGWIWDITSVDDTIYSCSWDQHIKVWTLTESGLVPFKTYEMYMRTNMVTFAALVMERLSEEGAAGALLSLAMCPELSLLAAGSFFKTVLIYDTKSGSTPIVTYEPHRGAVVKVVMNSEFIVSTSEDKTVSVWDLRTRKVINNFTITESFPMCICMQKDVIYVGDNSAKLYVLDPKKNFEVVKSYSTEHKKGITGVHVSPGSLITTSTDKTVRIATPTDPPRHLATLESSYGAIVRSDYLNGVLGVSGTEGIQIWRPKSHSNASFERANGSDNDRSFVGCNSSESDPV